MRTSYAEHPRAARLAVRDLADAGEVKRPPAGFHLHGRRLRLWLAAAGAADPPGFLLRLGAADEHVPEPVGAALAARGPAGGAAGRAGGRAGVPDRQAAGWPASPT